jgi:inward rectifier potassium channel
MSFIDRLKFKNKAQINTGFGANASNYGGRLVNKKGNANIEKRGIGYFEKISWYHSLLNTSWSKFFSIILISFFILNFLFAIVYYALGIDHLNGVIISSPMRNFAEAFFFSCQTFTTVGYGRINPVGLFASGLASFEALFGLMSFALVTGLLYGRFAKPTAYLKFSENAIIAPYNNMTALMFRVAPYKNTTLTEAEAKITLGMSFEENGKIVNEFYTLPLEYSTVNALTLNWTMVHPINEDSPLHKFTKEDFAKTKGEIIVFLKAFDDMFSNTVVARTSYTFEEIVVGAKFEPMYKRSEEGSSTILNIDRINSYTSVDLTQLISQ